MARPPLAEQRLSIDGDGLVVLELKRPFRDGTTHTLFEPRDFIARLAALVPRPRLHLLRYHGLFAPNARHRRLVVPPPRAETPAPEHRDETPSISTTAPMGWMSRLKRVFGIEIERCPRCGARVPVIATVTEPSLIPRILEHRRRPEHAEPAPRAPPLLVAG